MKSKTVEERLSVLEKEVAQLKQRVPPTNGKRRHWLEEIAGSMKDYPEFEEVVRLGAKIRQADRPRQKKA